MFDKRLMELCPESRRYIIANIILQWLEMFMNTVMIYCVAQIFLYCYNRETAFPMNMVLLMAASIFVRFFLSRYALRMSHLASRTIMGKMRTLIYDKLLKLGGRYTEKVSTAELVQESVEGVEQLESYFGQYMPQFFYAFIAPLTLFVLFGILGSWSTAIVLLICVPLIPGAIMMVQKFAKKLLGKYWGEYTQLGSTFLENMNALITLKTYEADAFKNEEMNEESERFRKITMKVLMMQLNSIIIMDFFTYAGAALGIIRATKDLQKGNIDLRTCIFMVLLSAEFFLPMRKLGSYFHVAMNGMAASDKIFNFLNLEEPERKDAKMPSEDGDICLRKVSFSYDGVKDVLCDVDMEMKEGDFTAIVGESGSGKSTVASLLMKRNRCERGQICVGGVPIEKIDDASLMRSIAYVGFNPFFFKGTIREALLMARPEAKDEELWHVLKQMQIADFFEQGEGLESRLSENAMNLSGGQRQRLALARAILFDAPIYIFDEAASNIDIESEEIINKTIHDLSKKKTIIMISHRLASTKDADIIYVMEKGKVAEKGSHEELMKKKGVYRKLYDTQKELEGYGRAE